MIIGTALYVKAILTTGKNATAGRRTRDMAELKFKITQSLFRLSSSGKFHKELNKVSWNDREPVYDLRGWNENHTEMTKGITLSEEEFQELKNKLAEVIE